jgi:hypothetical protein
MTSQYSRYSGYSRAGKKRIEVPVTEEMTRLVPTSRICINVEHDTIYVYNGKERPVTAPVGGDALTDTDLLKRKIMDMFKIREDAVIEWIGLLGDQLLQLGESGLEDEDEDRKTTHYVHKYTSNCILSEAILEHDTKPMFLQMVDAENGVLQAELLKEISLPDSNIVLRPLDKISYLSVEYSFSSEEEINSYIERARKETLDSLYYKVKPIWKKYRDADEFHIVICAADTIFTYFQDKLGMTHYLLFVGDNDAGKTNNLLVFQQLAYRPLYNISVTPANIYRSLGSIEEGQVTILEDEIDSIDERDEKMTIYKGGYHPGVKVARNDDTSSGRKSQGFYTYCFKAFTSEKQPDSIKAKGFNERVFVIKCQKGFPINYYRLICDSIHFAVDENIP